MLWVDVRCIYIGYQIVSRWMIGLSLDRGLRYIQSQVERFTVYEVIAQVLR